MALLTDCNMDKIVRRVVEAVRTKANEFGAQEGVVVVGYCNENGKGCFNLIEGEVRTRAFSLRMDYAFTEGLQSEEEDPENFGSASGKISKAMKVYAKTDGRVLTSQCPEIGIDDPGCVTFPIIFDSTPFGRIYVSVSGMMSNEQDELCAWEAYGPIVDNLGMCRTSNTGPV